MRDNLSIFLVVCRNSLILQTKLILPCRWLHSMICRTSFATFKIQEEKKENKKTMGFQTMMKFTVPKNIRGSMRAERSRSRTKLCCLIKGRLSKDTTMSGHVNSRSTRPTAHLPGGNQTPFWSLHHIVSAFLI